MFPFKMLHIFSKVKYTACELCKVKDFKYVFMKYPLVDSGCETAMNL